MNATETAQEQHLKAVKRYQTEQRFRALTQTVVSRAMNDHPALSSSDDAWVISSAMTEACALMLSTIYDEDAELTALRAENESLRAAYLKMAELIPMPADYRASLL